MTRQSAKSAWRVGPSERDNHRLISNMSSESSSRSSMGMRGAVPHAVGQPGAMMGPRYPQKAVSMHARPSRQSTLGRSRHLVSCPRLLLICILYLIMLVAQCSCQRASSFSDRGATGGSHSPSHLRSADSDHGVAGTQELGQTSCRLSSNFYRVMTTDCVPCPLSSPALCPVGTVPLTEGTGDRRCPFLALAASVIPNNIIGCSHQCQVSEIRTECCSGYWGPMCMECPGGAGNPCNQRGRCQGSEEGQQCQCNPAFTGVSCELCARDDVYGPNCDGVCDCVYGVCDSGARGTGFCLCDAGYQGPRCDQPKISCGEPACHAFAICSPPVTDGQPPQCVCSPGYSGDGRTSCVENDPCQNPNACSTHAHCNHTPPGRHTCECLEGYYGDGVECYPINYCQQHPFFLPCRPPTTKCVFDGPRQYHCECEEGYENYVFPLGCSRIDVCRGPDAPQCPPHSVCTMTVEGHVKCACLEGFRGDGEACYGSIMQVLRDLNSDPTGTLQGSLTTAINMFDLAMGYLLSGEGLYTVFVPTEQAFQELDYELNDRAFRDVDFGRYLMKLHTIPNLLDAYTLNSTQPIHTLAGILAEVDHKDSNFDALRYRLFGSNNRARLIHTDIPAANGVIHIIDRVLYEPAPVEDNRMDSVTSILASRRRFSQLYSLLRSVGISTVIPPGEPVTIFAPANKAFNQLPDGALTRLTSPGGIPNLRALLRNHVVRGAMLLMQDLITTGGVTSLHGATTYFFIHRNGLISVDRGTNVTFSDIGASDGYIHSMDGLIVPSDIDLLMSHRCDNHNQSTERGPCTQCNETMVSASCPVGSVPVSDTLTQMCLLERQWEGGTMVTLGCQISCLWPTLVPECCDGFYGEHCQQCPGGFAVPCSGHGQCDDLIQGTGLCTCDENFTGTACELCRPNMFGASCNQSCTCVHGMCDGGPQGTGHCKGGCDLGFIGTDCNVPAEGCGPEDHICHKNATCDTSGSQIRCICQAGYTGSGLHCEPLNPCRLAERGSCHRQAICTYTGPGTSTCTCNDGWAGDGFECDAIDPCQAPDHGGCGEGAICAYISPGVNQCYCNLGYYGNGTVCEPINPCLLMTNGGCHEQAECVQMGPGTSDCQCRDGYGGNGWLCYQSLPLEIATTPSLRRFYELIQLAEMEEFLATAPGLTVFPPTNEAFQHFEQAHGAVSQLNAASVVKMHIVNGTFSERDLYRLAFDDDQFMPSLLPFYRIQIHDCDHLCVNDIPVQLSDIPATNGLIHILGEVLWLQDGPDQDHFSPSGAFSPSATLSFTQLIDQNEANSTFLALLEQFGLVDVINNAGAYTVFFPTNEAVASFNASRITRDILQYHIVLGQAWTVPDIYDGMHLDSSLGHNYQLRLGKTSGNLSVNGVPVAGPTLIAAQGAVHIVPGVLFPLPNRCDVNYTSLTQTACGSCLSLPQCPQGATPLPNFGQIRCQYQRMFPILGLATFPGCRVLCRTITYVSECCSGFYGSECAECPGGWSSPCSNHGTCSNGTTGTGACTCFPNYTGTACELCEPGKYGPLCDQVCDCVNGHCREGIRGDGRCICNSGFSGPRCDLFAESSPGCLAECDPNAYCLGQQCICYEGYIGNGTYCRVHYPCSEDGVCSEHATCHVSPGGQVQCVCSQGYQGDGVYCQEVNPCLDGDDGGCHELAQCIHTGPAMSTCHCQLGYEGNGRTRCSPIDPCRENNGGCNARAHCTQTGPAQRNCTCFQGHIGDGLECTGNIAEELALNPNVSKFLSLLEEYRDMLRVLGSVGPLTILVPSNEAIESISQEQLDEWRENNQLSRVLLNHMVGCTAFITPMVNGTTSLTTLSAQPIHIMYSSAQGVTVNSQARVTMPNSVMSNGIMHTIDQVLVPPLLDPRPEYLEELPLELVAPNSTYSIFMSLMTSSGLLDTFSVGISLPVTIFMPTNEAFLELYPGKLGELRDPNNIVKTKEYLSYHIVPHRTIRTTQFANHMLQVTTLQGSNISIECHRYQGFSVNQDSKIIDTETSFRGGMYYGLDMVLEPPSIGGRCDIITNHTFSTDCYSCRRTIPCPLGSIPISENIADCFYSVGWYNYQRGCLRHCLKQEIQPHCCSRHYGADCRECPGGKRNPCSWHGECSQGIEGTGQCVCEEGFTGVACERCLPDRYGPNCEECQCTSHGQCVDGLSGTGRCFCDIDYMGTTCETRLLVTPTCNPYCHINAVCRPGNICECRPEYYGDGYSCTEINQCSFDNGGCSIYADCTQVGTEVTCYCHNNYEGDGYICQPVDPCMMNNGGCHPDAICQLTGPNSRSCACYPPLQGDGISFCTAPPERPPLACSIDNGGCHENALCFDDSDNPVGPSSDSARMGSRTPPPRASQRPRPTPSSFGRPRLDNGGLSPKAGQGVICKCKEGYVGTGVLCNGNAFETLGSMKNLSIYYRAISGYAKMYPEGLQLVDTLKSETSILTLFVPINTAKLANTTFTPNLIGNHIVSGQAYHKDHLVKGATMTAWSKGRLTAEVSTDKKVMLINKVPVKVFDIPMSNGVLHIVSEPITVDTPIWNPKNRSGDVSVSKVFAGILITVFVILLIVVVGIVVCIKVKRKQHSDTLPVISRYSVNGGTEDGSVTFSRSNMVSEEDEDEESEKVFRNPTFHRRAYNTTDMDSETIGFADLDFTRAY
ncbi:stabilin-2-like isoform X2 [Acanthaster planci]|uniref:Stabilin-2-like isoform X2 n=1 Tax=Acanthaster planci TaxID=133434 RepID=A0A8B7Z632_ACAPL|nr:stabilin-2-like isoform X2 [Acanthaster planci]